MRRSWILSLLVLSFSMTQVGAQVRYYFINTSAVNQLSYADDEIYVYFQLGMPGMNGYYNPNTGNWEDINTAPNMIGPNGQTFTDANVRLNEMPTDAAGDYYLDLPEGSTGRIYIGFGGPVYTTRANNPLLEAPGNPNYYTKIETIELTLGGQIFTNTSRVDRYAYPMGEELYCSGEYYDKVGETLTHEQVITKWKLFVNDDFQNSYDPVRDIITQMGHTPYFQDGNPGNDYFDDFIDQLFAYYSTTTLRAEWGGIERTANVVGNTLIWNDGTRFDRSDFELEDIVGAGLGSVFNNGIGQIVGVCLNRGVIQLTSDLQVWDDPNNFFKNPIKNDYTHFFHSDFVSFEGKTYALAYDDVFDQSSTQSCQTTPEKVVLSLGGYGTEHTQTLTNVYIDPQDPGVDQYKTIQLEVKGLDQGLVDMNLPNNAIVTWAATDPDGGTANNLINSNGLFGPTDVLGDYTVSVTVQAGGNTFTASTTVTVVPAGTTGQVCTGSAGPNAEYKLEVIGQRVYLTLVPGPGWTNSGYVRLYFGESPDLGTMGANEIIVNQAFHLEGHFFGEGLYLYVFTENNGGTQNGNPVHIQSLGTCDGLEIEETIINIQTTPSVTIDDTQTHQISVSGSTNKGNTVTFPDPLFKEPIIYTGAGVNSSGLFTPPDAGVYPIQINYDGILIETEITVTSSACSTTLDLGPNKEICAGESTQITLPAGSYTGTSWTGTGVSQLNSSSVNEPIFTCTTAGSVTLSISTIDGSGCSATGSLQIEVKEKPQVTLPTINSVCAGDSEFDINATVNLAGGTGTWTNASKTSETSASVNPTSSGSFAITYDYELNGCTSSTATTTLNVIAAPSISITYPENTVCEYESILPATLSNGLGSVRVIPSSGSIAANGDFDPTASGPGVYQLIYEFTEPSASCPSVPDTFEITVSARPTTNISSNPSEVCSNSSSFTLNAPVPGGTFSGSGVTGNQFDPSGLSTANNPHVINYTYADPITGCEALEARHEISVIETTSPIVSSQSIINTKLTEQDSIPSFCANGNSVQWYATTDLNQTPLFSGACFQTLFQDVSPTDGLMDIGTYSVYATKTENGCQSNPVEVNLIVTDCPTSAPNTQNSEICFGSDLPTLTSSDNSGVNYQWFAEDGTTLIFEGESIDLASFGSTYSSVGQYTFYVSKEGLDASDNPCRGPQSEVTLIVNEKPDVKVEGGSICSSDSFNLKASVVNPSLNYEWKNQTSGAMIPGGSSITVSPTSTTNYSLIVINTSGCSDTSIARVEVIQKPVPEILSRDRVICKNNQVRLIATKSIGQSFSYQWFFSENDSNYTLIDEGAEVKVDQVGYYFLQMTNFSTCTTNSDTIQLQQEELTFEIIASDDSVKAGEEVTLLAQGIGNYSYEWETPLGIESGEELIFEIKEDTRFILTAASDNCRDTLSILIREVSDLKIPNGFSPNGDGKNDTWNIQGLSGLNAKISVYNRWGILVYEALYSPSEPWLGVNNNGDALPISTYYYVITSDFDQSLELSGTVTILR